MNNAEYFLDNAVRKLSIDHKKTAEKIRELRRAKGMKQCDWEEIFDVSHTTANQWENPNCQKIPELPRLCVMAKIFGVSIEDIIFTTDIEMQYIRNVVMEETGFYDIGRKPRKTTMFPKYKYINFNDSNGNPLSGIYEIDDGITIRVKNGRLADVQLENGEILPAIDTNKNYIEHWKNGEFIDSEQLDPFQKTE